MRRLSHTGWGTLAALMLSAALLLSCEKEPSQISLSLKLPRADYQSGSQFVSVEAEGEWTLTITGDAVDWASLGTFTGDEKSITLTGIGDDNMIVFNWALNLSEDERSCTLLLASGESEESLTFSQEGAPNTQKTASKLESDKVYGWMELPALQDGLYFITHYMNDGKKRNYSYCWDTDALVAHWVAYPLNSSLIGSGNRTDQWGPDPKVPRDLQPELYGWFGAAFQRGHQIPSADRLSYEANTATFYFTNLTPQRGALNEGAWVGLEGMVRTWSRTVDTLYVVTGCTIEGSHEYAYDNVGKKVTVPTGYYKALLAYKKGANAATKGYVGVGFYFDHKGYDNERSVIMAQSMTVDELESKVGVDFFVNLPKAIGETLAQKVESTKDSFWK